ncbi:amino acid adenylation domain-containing protein [Polymorphospora lycopeni]|uniref:Amino acid adenylation domain-containing protein n=1 Tax=Polymorphospora lycopeni TaxID=3140240 RepID=A0ABV5CSH4_9ACTN
MIELPLSPAQERLWFLDRFDPGQPNNVAFARRLHGPLDPDLLARALAVVTTRHEALRATFVERDGAPVQLIADPGEFDLERVDLSAEPEQLREDRAREIGWDYFDTRFDLAAGPLIRAALLRFAADDHLLVIVVHHVVFDGASQAILIADLGIAYGALLTGTEPVFTPLPVGWGDYVREQADQPPGKTEQDLAYWRERLADAPALTLPTDLPRPLFKTPRTERVHHRIAGDLAGQVQRLARSQRCTPYMVLLTAWQLLLGRHAGQTDVSVGSASAGRSRTELEPLVGCFVHTLVMRGDLSGDPTVAELLRRTRTTALEAYAHQQILFERLVGELDVARDVSRTPLFETMFILHTQDSPEMDILPGIKGAPFSIGITQVLFDLVLDAWIGPEMLALSLRYDTGLFTPDTVRAYLQRYEVLLRAMIATPDARLSELPMDDVAGQRQVLAWGQGPRRRYSGTVPGLFAARAAAHPDAPAVDDQTYGDLDARANRTARHLAGLGAGPGTVVGICLDRGPDLVATLLAVWRCGAAYLPLDPNLPAARLSWLRADAGATHLVTRRGVAPDLDPAGYAHVVDLADDPAAGEPADAVEPRYDPQALAYVLHTSGSTGRPKGVEVSHAALTNLLLSMRDTLGSGPSDVWLGITSLSFDISGLELYLPLVTGARLVLVPEDSLRDGVAVVRIAHDNAVTHVQATPSGWRMLLDAGFNTPTVTALTGGEALPPRLARELRPRVRRLVNVYGPTETTIWSTAGEIADAASEITLGGPLANTQLYVVDAALRPVPVGVPGELLIGGAGVALGYRGRPELTAQRFVPDPYGPPGARLYRTGDRVRWLRGGKLEFLGRVDHQVKIRGHRIELGEVETRLGGHPDVHLAAVVTAGEGHDARLVGYVTAAPGAEPSSRQLRAHLAEELPAYMVPGQVVVLDAMPLNTAGKIDRRNLPAAEAGDLEVREYVAPRTELEEMVTATWGEVLGREQVGVLDDFFDIGGHSLLATRVVARLGAALGLEVPIRVLFLHSTAETFAAAVEELLVADVEQLSDDEVESLLDGGVAR